MSPQTVFLHFPKTAGTTLGDFLVGGHETSEVVASWRQFSPDRGTAAALLHGHLLYEQIEQYLDTAYCVTMLRHPVERAISFYYHLRRSPGHPDASTAAAMSLEEFMAARAGSQMYLTQLTARPVSRADGSIELEFRGSLAERLEMAKARLERFDHVAMTDQLCESMRAIAAEQGWTRPTSAGVLNAGGHGVTRDNVSAAVISACESVCSADLELYEYARTLSSRR